MTDLPKSYRVITKRCGTCRRCFVKWDYDDPDIFYCTFKAPRRPRCMSSGMGEVPYPIGGLEYKRADKAWDAWAKGRRCEDAGFCDEWKARKS